MKYLLTCLLLLALLTTVAAQEPLQLNIENKAPGSYVGSVALEIGGSFYIEKFEAKAKKENTPTSGGFFSPQEALTWLSTQSSFSGMDWSGVTMNGSWKDNGAKYELQYQNSAWQGNIYSVEIQPFNAGGNVGSPLVANWADYNKKELKADYKAENCTIPYDSTSAQKWKTEAKVKLEQALNPIGVAIDQTADSLMISVKDSNNVAVLSYVANIIWVDPAQFGLNIDVNLSAPANGNYYVPTETFAAQIILTNDGGDTLWLNQTANNKVEKLELWLSGPKQDYAHVPGYSEMKIVDGYNLNTATGFDTLTNSIDVTLVDTMNLDPGTYTLLIKAKRKGFGPEVEKYLLTDFQVLTDQVTSNPTVGWATNCNACHPLEKHKATEIALCVVCHTDDFTGKEFVNVIHKPHAEHNILNCLECHVNSQGNDDPSFLACGTCHNGVITDSIPASHSSYTNDMCVLCHASGPLSPDSAHYILTGLEPLPAHIPQVLELRQNYPNPFNPTTKIEFLLPSNGKVRLVVYDVTGRVVDELVNEELAAGKYGVNWNASGRASGVYFYRLETPDRVLTRKMMLMK